MEYESNITVQWGNIYGWDEGLSYIIDIEKVLCLRKEKRDNKRNEKETEQ